jgi:hypothetical protein
MWSGARERAEGKIASPRHGEKGKGQRVGRRKSGVREIKSRVRERRGKTRGTEMTALIAELNEGEREFQEGIKCREREEFG